VAVAVEVAGRHDGVHAGPVVGEVRAGAGLEAPGAVALVQVQVVGAGIAADHVGAAVTVEVEPE